MKKRHFLLKSCFAPFLLSLSSCNDLDKLPTDLQITPKAFCSLQPFVEFGGWTLMQPTSSILVYFLGFYSIAIAFVLYKNRGQQKTQFWWSISLLFGGVGTLLAGTSFHAFAYEIKCAGREFCVSTSWFEVIFLVLNIIGGNAMTVAMAYSSTEGFWRKLVLAYAAISVGAYVILTIIGLYFSIPFLLSFGLLTCFSIPTVLIFLGLNAWQYLQKKNRQDLILIGNWLLLILTMASFYAYAMAGFTSDLWANGYWFSDNDALHLGMLIWVIYIGLFVRKEVRDV